MVAPAALWTTDSSFLQQLTTIEFPYLVALTLIRTSIAILLLRVFSAAPWFKWSSEHPEEPLGLAVLFAGSPLITQQSGEPSF